MADVNSIIDLIDGGLQSSLESGLPVDHTQCVRCQVRDPVDGDFCRGCRAYLLGDSDTPPDEIIVALVFGNSDMVDALTFAFPVIRGPRPHFILLDETL